MLRLVLLPVFCATLVVGQQHYNYQTTERPRIYHPPAPLHYSSIGDKLDGDYKFGYDTGKGPAGQSFREEVRLPDGSVKGSYGYVDDAGQQRIVKYTAGAQGFVLDSDTAAGQAAAPRAAARPAYRAPQPQPQPAYRAPAPEYRAPAPQYRAPAPEYRAPAQEYRAPPPQVRREPLPQYREPPAQQYRQQAHYQPAPEQTYTNPTRNPAYNPHHAAYFASIGKPYVAPRQRTQEEIRREQESYGPPVIPYDLLSYNIGTAQG